SLPSLHQPMEDHMTNLKPAILTVALALAATDAQATTLQDQRVGMYAGYVTENLMETRDFFVAKLGFAVAFDTEWCVLLTLEEGQLCLRAPVQEGQSAVFRKAYPGHGAWITFDVPNVDTVHARAVAAGIPIAVPLRDEPWGERHFSVVAPNGLAL